MSYTPNYVLPDLLPSLCSVCQSVDATQIVPERSTEDWLFYAFCPLCLDALIGLFPLSPRKLVRRELTGRMTRMTRATRG